jgi:hypothetical protein
MLKASIGKTLTVLETLAHEYDTLVKYNICCLDEAVLGTSDVSTRPNSLILFHSHWCHSLTPPFPQLPHVTQAIHQLISHLRPWDDSPIFPRNYHDVCEGPGMGPIRTRAMRIMVEWQEGNKEKGLLFERFGTGTVRTTGRGRANTAASI